jgi:hypothetical protein
MAPILSEIFAEVPAELATYFDRIKNGRFAEHRVVELNLLPIHEAVGLTNQFREFPVIQALDGFVLDDAETSNYHVYLNHRSLKGTILYLDHDGDTRVVFASLDDFLAAADTAIESGPSLRGFHPIIFPRSPRIRNA